MPLGFYRINSLAKTVAVGGVTRDPVTLTANGDAQIDTAQYKIGSSSALFDGAGRDYIGVDTVDIAATDDITIEGWVRFNSLNSVWNMIGAASTTNYFGVKQQVAGTTAWLGASWNGTSGTFYNNMVIPTFPSLNTWYHFAFVKSGSTVTYFWDGTELTTVGGSSGTMASDKGFADINRIGDWTGSSGYELDGHLDEIRVSDTARYSSGFTPSTSAFTNDANTVLLIHAEGADGSTTFEDDGG